MEESEGCCEEFPRLELSWTEGGFPEIGGTDELDGENRFSSRTGLEPVTGL